VTEAGVSSVDHYEILELSPNANPDTVERVFRHLARRYHPDNTVTGDRERFDLILAAYTVLRDPEKRAQFDVELRSASAAKAQLAHEAFDPSSVESDVELQMRILSLFYVKRRQDVANPGIGELELEQILDTPIEHLEFHIWYLREKHWIARRDDGLLAITVDGVERANSEDHVAARKLLTHRL
jgi:curved DNA-binding protein CbpA